MRLFLDASVLLAAAGSSRGASRAIFSYSRSRNWHLIASPYVVSEVLANLWKLSAAATTQWLTLRRELTIVDDVVSIDRPALTSASKDRPVLFTALAWADILLTLDRADFSDVIGGAFYGLRVMLPAEFLRIERDAGRLNTKGTER